jgi:large subunit ribosomal protein L3
MKKGKKMAGQYGSEVVTTRNLKLVRVDLEDNLLLIGGAVPGPNGAFVIVRETNMKR